MGKKLMGLVAAAMFASAGEAGARPDPCFELPAIVAAYQNTSTNQGKTAAELFDEMGRLTVMAKLGQAAAHVQDHEVEGIPLNEVSPNADAAYGELSGRIRWLDAADLGASLAPEYDTDSPFCTRGLLGGIYTNVNAAALVGRMSDALFLAFRATNDGWSLADEPLTPDSYDWVHQNSHYDRYSELLPAIAAYVAAHSEITNIYVAGDSLGAAMAQMYMLKRPNNSRMRAYVFGSPGNPSIAFQDSRIWTFIDDNDPILLVPELKFKTSGKRFLVHIGQTPLDPPSTIYHNPQAYVRIMEHLDRHGIGWNYLASKFAGGSITRWNSISLRLAITSEEPEDFAAGVPGKIVSPPGSDPRVLAGGDGSDTLVGGIGEGDLFGFGGGDCLKALNRPERLYGGGGQDQFVLRGSYELFGGRIMDFVSGTDKVVSLNTLPLGESVIDGVNFVRGSSAARLRPTLIYDRRDGSLSFDIDGTGYFPSYLVGKFPNRPKLLASDIALKVPAVCG